MEQMSTNTAQQFEVVVHVRPTTRKRFNTKLVLHLISIRITVKHVILNISRVPSLDGIQQAVVSK